MHVKIGEKSHCDSHSHGAIREECSYKRINPKFGIGVLNDQCRVLLPATLVKGILLEEHSLMLDMCQLTCRTSDPVVPWEDRISKPFCGEEECGTLTLKQRWVIAPLNMPPRYRSGYDF
jgi:hypothetical protein